LVGALAASSVGMPAQINAVVVASSSFTYRFRYAPSYRQSGSDRLAGGAF
jgi:hypothetical protein